MKIEREVRDLGIDARQRLGFQRAVKRVWRSLRTLGAKSRAERAELKSFNSLKGQLLLAYLAIMETILILFSAGIYFAFSHDALLELDRKLLALAQFAAPSLSHIDGDRDSLFMDESIRDPAADDADLDKSAIDTAINIEWFDNGKHLLARQGKQLPDGLPQPGLLTLPSRGPHRVRLRTATLQVSIERSQVDRPPLKGYVRVSQSLADIEMRRERRLWFLGFAIVGTMGLVTVGGFWLTQKATEPVEKSVRKLKQFTADASHELRSPLTAIQASVEVLRNHPERIHPKDIRKLAAIASATEQMTHLVRDLLFLARSDAEGTSAANEWSEISLNQLLQEAVEWLEPIAQNKQIVLSLRQTERATTMGSPSQLRRLFTNLIENAINYTPSQGRVTVSVGRYRHWAQVKVEDTGIGIAPEHLPAIFDRFWRADRARSRREGGTGLGLAIARAIAQQHQGKIEVSSVPDAGSCFVVLLPAIGDRGLDRFNKLT